MKKAMLIILAVLPIVLLMVIAFADQLTKEILEISEVESVTLTDKRGKEYPDDATFTVERGQEKSIYTLVGPKSAGEKRVKYTSSDESIFTVDNSSIEYDIELTRNGLVIAYLNKVTVKAVSEGTATLTVTSMEDGSIQDTIRVSITADIPYEVDLGADNLTLKVNDAYTFRTLVNSHLAKDSSVKYSSSNPEIVKVNASGRITAEAPGEAVITVTTVSGGLTDTCRVTVIEGKQDLYFELPESDGFIMTQDNIYRITQNEIDLLKYLRYNEELINPEDIKLYINLGKDFATITDGVLTITKENDYVTIYAYVGDPKNPTYFTQVTFVIRK